MYVLHNFMASYEQSKPSLYNTLTFIKCYDVCRDILYKSKKTLCWLKKDQPNLGPSFSTSYFTFIH